MPDPEQVRRQAGVTNDTLGAATELWRTEGLGGFYSSYGSNYAYSTPVRTIAQHTRRYITAHNINAPQGEHDMTSGYGYG